MITNTYYGAQEEITPTPTPAEITPTPAESEPQPSIVPVDKDEPQVHDGTKTKAVQTGDDTPIMRYLALMAVAALAVLILIFRRRRAER